MTFQPESQWRLRLDTALAELTGNFESCHVYVVYGHSGAPDQATLSLFNLGAGFAWRDCVLVPAPGVRVPLFDGRDLLVPEVCFNQFDDSWRERIKRPPRRLSPMDQVNLRLAVDPS